MILDIKDLKSWGLLNPGAVLSGTFNATTTEGQGAVMQFKSSYTDRDKYLELSYTAIDHYGNRKDYNYRIYIEARRSNLGKGIVHILRCPFTREYGRRLYMIRESQVFKHRKGYSSSFYGDQYLSHRDRMINRPHRIAEKLDRLYNKRRYYSHKGKDTRLIKRIELWEDRDNYANYLSNQALLKLLDKIESKHNPLSK